MSPSNNIIRSAGRRGFTLIELLVVIAIIVILAAITLPAIKGMTKSNDQSQAANVVRAYLATARTIAVSQHRMAGVVFFEETGTYASPVRGAQTGMEIFVQDYGSSGASPTFSAYNRERAFLPAGIKLATLSDSVNSVNMGENTTPGAQTRAILFDANGELVVSGPLQGATFPLGAPYSSTPGTYPQATGDWKFFGVPGITTAYSSPGFFLYSKSDFDSANLSGDPNIAAWLKKHADVVIVNSYTGTVIR